MSKIPSSIKQKSSQNLRSVKKNEKIVFMSQFSGLSMSKNNCLRKNSHLNRLFESSSSKQIKKLLNSIKKISRTKSRKSSVSFRNDKVEPSLDVYMVPDGQNENYSRKSPPNNRKSCSVETPVQDESEYETDDEEEEEEEISKCEAKERSRDNKKYEKKEIDDFQKVEASNFEESITKKLCRQHGWNLGEILGKGGFGAVYKCTRLEAPYEVAAVKRVNAPKKQESNKMAMKRKNFLYCEIECLLLFKHPNSIQLFDFFRYKDWLFITMEFAPNGSLQEYYMKNKPLKEDLTCYWMQQIAKTLYSFHSTLKIAHRDIKPANILLDCNFDTKLSDFGIAAKCWDNIKMHVILSETFIGTPSFLSPQMLKCEAYNPFKSDVWAAGIITFQLLFNHFPFRKKHKVDSVLTQMEQYPSHLISLFKPNISREATDVILGMLNPIEIERTTFRLVLKYSWMKRDISRTSVLGK